MATLSNFGEQFAAKALMHIRQRAVAPGITNTNYEGEIKRPGDRVNILSFLNNILISDYSVGSDMASETIVDAEDQLVVEKRKYYNFALDRLEDLFTYADNIVDVLTDRGAAALELEIDKYVLNKAVDTKAGSWVGVDLVVVGGAATMASIATTATGGTVTIVVNSTNVDDQTAGGPVENPRDGSTYQAGFHASDVGKGFRLRSTAALVTPWYRISGVTSTVVATLTEWDGATSGSDFAEGFTLRGVFGGDGKTFDRYGSGEAPFVGNTGSGYGWEIQAAIATAISSSSIYNQMTLLAEALDTNEVPTDNRHFTVLPEIMTQVKQASQFQPSGITEIYTGTVINGKILRAGGFDLHQAAGGRVSSRAGHPTSSGTGTDSVNVTGSTGYFLLANHIDMITYADKWSESRVVDAENQFAKKYQGLYLYGALTPAYRRKFGALLFGSF